MISFVCARFQTASHNERLKRDSLRLPLLGEEGEWMEEAEGKKGERKREKEKKERERMEGESKKGGSMEDNQGREGNIGEEGKKEEREKVVKKRSDRRTGSKIKKENAEKAKGNGIEIRITRSKTECGEEAVPTRWLPLFFPHTHTHTHTRLLILN